MLRHEGTLVKWKGHEHQDMKIIEMATLKLLKWSW